MAETKPEKIHKCKICKHTFSPIAHHNHCPICGTIVEKFRQMNLAFNGSGNLLNIRRAKFYGRGR